MSGDPRDDLEFALNFEKELIRSVGHDFYAQFLRGWLTRSTSTGWVVDVLLQSPDYHDGEMVAATVRVPSRQEDLGMELQTYIMIQASGATEKFVSSTPEATQRLRYFPRSE